MDCQKRTLAHFLPVLLSHTGNCRQRRQRLTGAATPCRALPLFAAYRQSTGKVPATLRSSDAYTTSSSVEDIWKHVTGTKLEREKEAELVPGLSGLTNGIHFSAPARLLTTCLEQTAPTSPHAARCRLLVLINHLNLTRFVHMCRSLLFHHQILSELLNLTHSMPELHNLLACETFVQPTQKH